MRAVIYCRVSADDRKDERSVGEQEAECRLAAVALGWTVVEVFVDNDVSASRYARKGRPGHEALLAYLGNQQVDVLMLWETSRGDRELERWAGLLNLCRRREVRIHVTTHERTYDLEVARDWKAMATDGVDNAYASEETRNRVARAVRANAQQGRPHGKLPYGYVRTYDERGGFLAQIEHPEQAAVVRECGRRVAAGESLYSIAQDLNARGVPAPRGGAWIPTQIKRLVTNPRYVGQRVHQGVVIGQAVWPAILDGATFAECTRRMSDPRRHSTRDRSLKYLLTGILRCGECGSPCRVIKNRGYHSYACWGGKGTFCVSVRTIHAEEFVVEQLVERLEQPDILSGIAARSDRAVADAESDAGELRTRLKGFYDQAALGKISPAGLAAIEEQLLPQIDEADERALQAPVPKFLRDVAGPGARKRWDRLELGRQREIVDKLAELRVGKTVRGARFDFRRLGESRWRGDDRTWGEHWTAAGVDA